MLLTVVGARPQFIKAAAVSRIITARAAIREVIVHTGQHYDENMSAVFFQEMEIPAPTYSLKIHGLGHGAMTGRMLEQLEEVLLRECPRAVMVYGDTNTTLAGALAAAKLHIPVVHVEAGLRSFNMQMPEELNRILTDRVSSILCCPTLTAVANLRREGYEGFGCRIELTGDVMQDAALYYAGKSADRATVVKRLGLDGKRFALCTVHRAENTDDGARLAGILAAIDIVAAEMPVVLPLHPRTRAIMQRLGLGTAALVIEPVGYFDMLQLLTRCAIVLTDSGGLQKEAFFFGKPCVTLRDETEWLELVEGGFNMLAGADRERIVATYRRMLGSQLDFDQDLYGMGRASQRIATLLEEIFA
jgi:UDP-GlcNAc3NAcA epimerase